VRSLLIVALVAGTLCVLPGCQRKKPLPVPGPQSAVLRSVQPIVPKRAQDVPIAETPCSGAMLEQTFGDSTCHEHQHPRLLRF
jgi:hypothetical protein